MQITWGLVKRLGGLIARSRGVPPPISLWVTTAARDPDPIDTGLPWQPPPVSIRLRSRRVSSLWVLFVAGVAAAAAAAPRIGAVAAATAIAVAAWRWSEVGLEIAAFAVLAVRPSLDIFSERRFGLSEFAPNPAVVFGLGVLCVACVFALLRAREGRLLWPNRALLRSHLWLLGACGVGLVSGGALYGLAGAATGARELVRVASIVAAFLIVLWWV